MTDNERWEKSQAFLKDFKAIVQKHAGTEFASADMDLLYMMQDMTSVFSPYIWSK